LAINKRIRDIRNIIGTIKSIIGFFLGKDANIRLFTALGLDLIRDSVKAYSDGKLTPREKTIIMGRYHAFEAEFTNLIEGLPIVE
jgi:hypothetical protein